MIRPRILITFEQQPSERFPARNKVITMPWVTEWEVNSSWRNLTDTAKIIFPKNLTLQQEGGAPYNLSSSRENPGQTIIAGNNEPPFLLRGDKVTIAAGYWYYDEQDKEKADTGLTEIFKGYITNVKLQIPIEVECQDNMYILKQVQVPPELRLFSSTTTLEQMINKLIVYVNEQKNSYLTTHVAPEGVSTTIGEFRIMNETVAQVLDRLRKDYKINSWFRGNDLHSSVIVYFPGEANTDDAGTKHTVPIFAFQQNIIEGDNMIYTRRDDVLLGALVYSAEEYETTDVNKDGSKQKRKRRLQVEVGDKEGEIRTLYFWNAGTEAKLKELGEANLRRYRYEGYRGYFLTYGEPVVRHGDHIEINDNILPERNGIYFIKGVTSSGGAEIGWRQRIELDMKISGPEGTNISEAEMSKGI